MPLPNENGPRNGWNRGEALTNRMLSTLGG